eukprot:GGOE01013814.1.p1 GENE.GGOE01013814.1~~GGOE01013814.1.p1  ORF type:complete len:337 (-),score=97.66 GGOE01013814.1:247-1221(-)
MAHFRHAWHSWWGYSPVDETDDPDVRLEVGDPREGTSRAAQTLLGLSVLGVILAGIMLWEYYNAQQGTFCDFSGTFSCSKLILLGAATLFNTPIAVLGLGWFITLFVVQLLANTTHDPNYVLFVLLWAVCGAGFVVYLISEEIVKGVICPVCTAVHIVDAIVLVLAVYEFWRYNSKPALREIPALAWKQVPRLLRRETLLIAVLFVLNVLPLVVFNAIHLFSGDVAVPIEKATSLAQCLRRRHVVLYTRSTCPHCELQKELFGTAMEKLDLITCDLPEGQAECAERHIQWFPTWILFSDRSKELKRLIGQYPLQKVADWAGCKF